MQIFQSAIIIFIIFIMGVSLNLTHWIEERQNDK